MLILGSCAAQAKIYRFPVYPEPRELKRPAAGLEEKPKALRILNISMGNYFAATAIEFEIKDNSYRRLKTYPIDFLQDAMQTVVNKDGCEAALRNQNLGQMFVDTMLLGTPHRRINIQALKEMEARHYLKSDEVQQHMQSAEGASPDGFIFVESLSWIGAAEALKIFHGEIPWERIAEVEGGENLSVDDIKALAAQGDKSIQLRVRRATLRIALGTPLPFEEDLLHSGRSHLIPHGPRFKFEFGRASQIPGLAHEAHEMAGLAAMVAAHHALAPGDAMVYFHSLKPSNTLLYREQLGGKVVPGLDQPDDTVLEVTLDELMNRTSKKMGVDLEALRLVKRVQEGVFHTFDWNLSGENMTPVGPIIIRPTRASFLKASHQRAEASKTPAVFHAIVDKISSGAEQSIMIPSRIRGDYAINSMPADWQQQAEYAISGFNPFIAEKDDLYLKKMLFSLPMAFHLTDHRLMITTGNQTIRAQALKLGMKGYEYVGDDHRVRWALVFTWPQLKTWMEADPTLVEKVRSESKLDFFSPSRHFFSLMNLDGLI